MPVTVALTLLATLAISQTTDSAESGPHTASRPNRRVLASEYDATPANQVQSSVRRGRPDDACLHDVSFTDERHGWAVGDHGVILHTADGGQRWSPQESGVICTLHSVCFVDSRTGWAAGGTAWPFLHDTSGVVLVTRDGGVTWQREPVLLPALDKIRFVTDRQGWAVGCSSAMYPSGMYYTRDGGLSWLPATTGGAMGLTTADLYDAHNVILGGSLGQLATISQGDFVRKSQAGSMLPGVHAMQIVPPSFGWLAGDGGWVALTADRGNSWRAPLGKLPAYAAIFDFHALAVRGGNCWIAGSPGSRVFSTSDAGQTWTAAPTGGTVPLEAIAFADDQHGWAVGQLGTIIATSDGGRTWQRQRAAGTRAALMALAGRAEDLPLELIARTCKDQGYFGVGEVVGRNDVEVNEPHGGSTSLARASGTNGDAPLADRLHQAMLQVGACGGEMAWGFPVPPAELQLSQQQVVENWNPLHNGHAADALIAHLVRQIRTWRPDVIAFAAGAHDDGLAEISRQALDAAVKLAADPAYLADQFLKAGCEPWSVERVAIVSESQSPQSSTAAALNCADWSSPLGQSWTDAALPARGLLLKDDRAGPAAFSIQTITSANDSQRPTINAAQAADLMTDIPASAGGPARRTSADASRSQGGTLDGLAQRRQIETALAHLEQDPEAFYSRLSKGNELPPGVDAAEAAVLTVRFAQRLYHTGHWELADKTFGLLLDRYPDDPLARWAAVRRLQYNVSGSLRVPLASGTLGMPDTSEQAILFARQIESARPDLFASPAIRFPLAAAYRRLGKDSEAERLYVLDRHGADRDTWWNCGRGERWLVERKGTPPRPMASCLAVTDRPHLDGRLDEPFWSKCASIVMSSPENDDRIGPASVMLAHDDRFLYIGIQCRQAAGVRYEATSEHRPRDPDLSKHDRIAILLDTDRTYSSYFQLTIDHRGWAADACCGDVSWNPRWFIAAQTSDGSWTAEAAIPLAELHAHIDPGKTVWAVGFQRIVPGVGFQSWTTPAAPCIVPEGFGWLGFE